jgi:CAAX prenyl protease-like protein
LARVNYREVNERREDGIRTWFADRPQIPYLIPFFVFVAIMGPAAFGNMGGVDWTKLWFNYLPAIYTLKTVVAALLLWLFWRYYTPIRWSHLTIGVLVGLFGTVLWIGTEYATQSIGLTHPPDLKTVYNPDVMLHSQWQRLLFLCIRIVGPTLVVPVMEELFFRDFIMRMLVRGARFEDVAVGTFSWFSLIGMSVLFAVNHVQWPAGFLYGLLMGILLLRTKSLGSCIVAHAVTNWTLYLYVIYRGDWQFM